jgi:hypothetical protein
MRIDFGWYRAHSLRTAAEPANHSTRCSIVRVAGIAAAFRLHVKCPCDNLDNCPGHSGRDQGSIVPERACFHLLA